MRIYFANNEVEQICNDETYARRKFPPKIVEKLQNLMFRLALYPKYVSMYSDINKKKYRSHTLKGDKKGIESLSLDKAYRVTLTLQYETDCNGEDSITILEVSKHYGD